jgi:hypothetical protein
MAELPQETVLMLPDEFSDTQLVEALETLRRDKVRSQDMGARARAYVKDHLSPRCIADQYHAAIEHFAETTTQALRARTVKAVAAIDATHQDTNDWLSLAHIINKNIPLKTLPRVLIDVSGLINNDGIAAEAPDDPTPILKELLSNPPDGCRVELVYASSSVRNYRYARQFALQLLGCPRTILEDDPLELRPSDIFLGFAPYAASNAQVEVYSELRELGVPMYFLMHTALGTKDRATYRDFHSNEEIRSLSILTEYGDGFICATSAEADALISRLDLIELKRERPINVGWLLRAKGIEDKMDTTRHVESTVWLKTVGSPDRSEDIAKLCALLAGRDSWPKAWRRRSTAFESSGNERTPLVVLSHV